MNKQDLNKIRKEIDDLFYLLFDKLDKDQKDAFINTLTTIDFNIKSLEDF